MLKRGVAKNSFRTGQAYSGRMLDISASDLFRAPRAQAGGAAALAALALLAGCAPLRPLPGPPPDLAALPLGPAPVRLLADSTWWTVAPRGGTNRLEERTVSWLRVERRAPPDAEDLDVYEDESVESAPRIRVDAFYPGGGSWTADPARVARARAHCGGFFACNQLRHSVRVPGYREGVLIRLEVRRTVRLAGFRGAEPMAGARACARRFAAFRQPAGYALSATLASPEGIPWRLDSSVDARGREWRWSAADVPAFPDPSADVPVLRFAVPPRGSAAPGWQATGDAYLDLLAPAWVAGPAVRAAARSLPGPDPASLADAAFRLVQSRVRYLADEERMHAYVPRPPERVLGQGYGDCKEMANLMRALLAARGVEARLALVSAADGPGPDPAYPSLAGFDHMILAVDAGDGARRWYDPTVAGAGPSASRLGLLGRPALVLSPGASAPDTIRPAPGYRNRVVTVSSLSPGSGGRWELKGTIGLKGACAFAFNQGLRAHPGPAEARAAVRDFLAASFGIRASAWEWETPAGDSAAIAYAMPADGLRLSLGAGGLKLDAPALMGLGTGLRGEAARNLAGFEQEDSWSLPPAYREPETRAFARDGAIGSWTFGPGEAKRAFRCGPLDLEDRARLDGFLDALSGFALAAVWR
jgi:transglutaminase-like putative cysteine protease